MRKQQNKIKKSVQKGNLKKSNKKCGEHFSGPKENVV